jgi:hypothetical protein
MQVRARRNGRAGAPRAGAASFSPCCPSRFIGPDSPRGREFAVNWQYPGFRRVFRLMTIVCGAAYLAEAAARVIIVETTSAGTALAVSRVMPYAVAGLLVAWMIVYGRHAKRKGERLAAASGAAEQGAPG